MSAPTVRKVLRVVLHPGDYQVTEHPITLSTLLGSCVAVCLYDLMHQVKAKSFGGGNVLGHRSSDESNSGDIIRTGHP